MRKIFSFDDVIIIMLANTLRIDFTGLELSKFKQLEMHGCILSIVATDTLVLKLKH